MGSLLESIDSLDSFVTEARFSISKRKKASPADRAKNKKYYRQNKSEIKKKNRKWSRSAKGRKWKRLSEVFKRRTSKRGKNVRRSVKL